MERDEFKALKVGDIVFGAVIELSNRGESFVKCSRFKLEVTKLDDASYSRRHYAYFKILDNYGKTNNKVGSNICFDDYDSYQLFFNEEDAIEYWNSLIYNGIDRLTSRYEGAIKRLKSKIIKI
jgi:hypothetical protein